MNAFIAEISAPAVNDNLYITPIAKFVKFPSAHGA